MTINQYKCEECEAQFELLDGNTTEVKCLGCGSTKVKKQGSKVFEEGGCGDSGCSSCRGCGH